MPALSADCGGAGGLTMLSSFTLTIHDFSTEAWVDGTLSLLKYSPLESVQLNTSGLVPFKRFAITLGDGFCMRIVDQHHKHLIRFSLHGLRLGLPSIDHVCLHCAKLEQLFIRVDNTDITDMVCFLFFEPATMSKLLGSPCGGTCASETSVCDTYQFQWATAGTV